METLIEFYENVANMKRLPRTGWLLAGIPSTESVADHSYSTSILANCVYEMDIEGLKSLSLEKILRLALIHDVAESKVGDIPSPRLDPASQTHKNKLENSAFKTLCSPLPFNNRMEALWEEYQSVSSEEAKYIKAIDALDMMLQAFCYQKAGFRNLDSFWTNIQSNNYINYFPVVKQILNILIEKRKQLK